MDFKSLLHCTFFMFPLSIVYYTKKWTHNVGFIETLTGRIVKLKKYGQTTFVDENENPKQDNADDDGYLPASKFRHLKFTQKYSLKVNDK